MLGGDMVEGMGIFPGQAYEVDSHLYEQLFEVSRLIGKTVSTLASNFESVRVVCEYGNHGRIGRYGEMPKGDNIDRISYEIARSQVGHLVKDWQSSDAWYQIVRIGNYTALLCTETKSRALVAILRLSAFCVKSMLGLVE